MEGQIPRPFARTGYVDDYYFIAQWFPKLGVLEDRGWNTHQFHNATEFYSDYGVYDVRITVPREFVVGATCRASLTSEPPARCAEGEIAPGNGADWNYRYWAGDVHDFAWTASPLPRLEAHVRAHGPPVEMQLLLQPEHAGQESRHFDATAVTLRFYGEWFGPHPYSHITIVDLPFKAAAAAWSARCCSQPGHGGLRRHASRNQKA